MLSHLALRRAVAALGLGTRPVVDRLDATDREKKKEEAPHGHFLVATT
jgi:hypothetical protein